MVGGGLEPSTAVMGWEMWYTVPVKSSITGQTQKQTNLHYCGQCGIMIYPNMSFDCAENPRIYMENMQAYAHRKA